MRLPVRAKVAVARLLCNRWTGALVGAAFQGVVPSGGLRIDTRSPAVTPDVRALLLCNLYERAEIRLIERHLPAALDVVELGASIGVVSAHVARRLRPGARLVCVEPNAALHPLLTANAARGGPAVRLETVTAAIAYPRRPGAEVTLALGRRNVDSRLTADQGAATVRVPARTLGEILDAARLDRYALVCDIEGAEAGILFDDVPALERCRFLVAELHETAHAGEAIGVEAMVDRLEELGFAIVDRRGPVVAAARPEARSSP